MAKLSGKSPIEMYSINAAVVVAVLHDRLSFHRLDLIVAVESAVLIAEETRAGCLLSCDNCTALSAS